MFNRILLMIIAISSLLYAEPSLAEVKQAVSQNPALLETPQAKAMMKEKGVTAAEVKQKLADSTNKTTSKVDDKKVVNNIDTDENKTKVDENTTNFVVENKNDLEKRINPFLYKTSKELRKELNEKQKLLTSSKLSRYSSSFYTNKNTIDSASLPTPDDYVISTGDAIYIHIYGDRDKEYELEVRNDGSIDLEFIGPVKIGGMKYKDAKDYLINNLKNHFKMSSFNIRISKYSTIQVTLIGDVKHPGIYNLSSFSTVKDLLIQSNGIRNTASVREILVKRNSKVIAKLDFYDLLFNGKELNDILLQHGDIVIIQNAKILVSIDGYVNNAAIFELKSTEKLSNLIEYAGGMKASASKMHIKVDRYSDNLITETFNISFTKAKNFSMKNGDKVYIYPLDDSANRSINIYGNIIRPGSYSIGLYSTLNEFFKENIAQGKNKFFLPETYFDYGVIKHYSESSLNYETKSFNLAKVIDGSEVIKLEAQDEIYIFSKNDIATTSYITTKGDVLIKSGKFRYFKGMTIKDAINASGVDGIIDDKVRVTTINTADRMPKTTFYSLKENGNIMLSLYDEVEVYDYYQTHMLEPVSIKGEVVNPITVFYENNMSLADLLEVAGGTTTKAYLDKIEIVRYYIDKERNRQSKIMNIDLLNTDKKEFKLQPYDEVTVYKIPKWGEKNTVTIKGEVRFPGTYTISNGEKLSSVIRRAGGYTDNAFVDGAVFTRESIRKNQIEQYNNALARVKRELAIFNAMPANSKKAASMSQASDTLNEVISEAQKYQPIGRVSIKLDEDLSKFEKSEYNLVLKDQDTLIIPSDIDTVTVFGEVFNPTSFVYSSNKSIEDYIELASGFSRSADKSNVYVIHADGTSEPIDSGWFSSGVEIKKGDTIVVPIYIKEYEMLSVWDSVARILSSFALTVASVKTLGVF